MYIYKRTSLLTLQNTHSLIFNHSSTWYIPFPKLFTSPAIDYHTRQSIHGGHTGLPWQGKVPVLCCKGI